MQPSFLGRALNHLKGDTLKAKALRSTLWTMTGVFGQNGLRLISNIILTKLLFPEAFGLMAMVQVFIVALQTFSDIGIKTAIIQSKRGDDPVFLDTAWTLQILRGFGLWLMSCFLAFPAAKIYDQPELALLLPVTALCLIGQGFQPTRAAQAERNLTLGRLTTIQLSVQTMTLMMIWLLAWWWQSVWALAVFQVISSVIDNILTRIYIPGHKNRLGWDRESLREIKGFGQFILFSTMASFLILMSDRAVLGAYVDVTLFGIYSIALTFGSLPTLIGQTLGVKVLFPLYRLKSPTESDETRRKIFKAGRAIAALGVIISTLLAFSGIWLLDLLYDDRYALAGPMLVLFALAAIPENVLVGSKPVLLAHGDSRRHFYLTVTSAAIQVSLLLLAVPAFGVVGAILSPSLTLILTYPMRAFFIAKYRAWDPLNDILGLSLGFALTGLACAWHWDAITKLFV